MITYTFVEPPSDVLSPKDLVRLIELYREQNWWETDPDNTMLLENIILGSHVFLVARDRSKIVGMGRAISDGAGDAYLQDVAISAPYHGQGIGTTIVDTLLNRLTKDGISWIGLIAERHTHGFYERLGFQVMPDAAPMLMKKMIK